MAGWHDRRTRRGAIAGVLVFFFLSIAPCLAQTTASTASAATDPQSQDLSIRRLELRGLEDNIEAAETQRRKLESDIEAIRTDRARLNAALIDTTTKIRQSETRADEAQKRLDGLKGNEDAIR